MTVDNLEELRKKLSCLIQERQRLDIQIIELRKQLKSLSLSKKVEKVSRQQIKSGIGYVCCLDCAVWKTQTLDEKKWKQRKFGGPYWICPLTRRIIGDPRYSIDGAHLWRRCFSFEK